MKTFVENDSDNQLYRIGEGGDADKEDRLEGPIYEWGEEADIEMPDGTTQKAYVSVSGELFSLAGGPTEFDSEDWDLAEEYAEQEGAAPDDCEPT